MGNYTRIIIVDDHPMLRQELRAALESDKHLQVVAEAENGESAFTSIREYEPDIAILGLDISKRAAFDVTRAIQESGLHSAIILLTMRDGEVLFKTVQDPNVRGYVLKESAIPEIVDCVETVMRGRRYISPQLSSNPIRRGLDTVELAREKPGLKLLTPAEQHILKLIAGGKSSRQIADELHISIRTVDRHRSNLCTKLDLHGSNALMKFALANRSQLTRGWQ